jgi:ribosomal protein L7/L12
MNRLLRAARIDDVPELSPEVQELARDPRRRIQAVRRHREQTGLSLADAKADIEDYYRTTVNR